MKPRSLKFLPPLLIVLTLDASAQVFSWEDDGENTNNLQGWTADAPNSIVTSTTGATDGVKALAITQPMSNMWYSTPTAVGLSPEQMQSIFTDATELKIDVSHPDPGYNSWFAGASVEIIMQGEKVPWQPLGVKSVALDGAPQTVTWALSATQAYNMATSGWAQIILKFTYGNGGATATEAVFHVDNFDSTIVTPLMPVADLYWKGDALVDTAWADGNWTTDEAGAVPGSPPPTDGTATVAFAATGATNLFSLLGADQNVNGIVVTAGAGAALIGGEHNLTLGSDGLWVSEGENSLFIETTGNVILSDNQEWRNKSTGELNVSSSVTGTGSLTKTGPGPLVLGGANTYSGGTTLVQGTILLGDHTALGAADAVLTMESGTLDLNGFSPTVGGINGTFGGIIQNSSVDPSVLTIDDATGTTYTCAINDGTGGGGVSLVKTGFGNTISNAVGNFTGSVTIEEGAIFTANAPGWGDATRTCLGNAQTPGRIVTVEPSGSLSFTNTNIFGNGNANASNLPAIVLDGAELSSSRYNQIGNLTLSNGSFLNHSTSDTGERQGYQFRGTITVTGGAPSMIIGNDRGNHLSSDTVFEVEGGAELEVFTPLINQSGDFSNAPGGLTKTGTGTMTLEVENTYTGATRVIGGTLVLKHTSLSDTAELEIAEDAVLHLNLMPAGTDVVGGLKIGEETMPVGIYGAVGSGLGEEFELPQITGTGFIQVGSTSTDPFDTWMATFTTLSGEDAEKGADPDGDGLTNLEEFALDGNPENGAVTGKGRSRIETVEDEQALVITLPVRAGASFTGTAPATATMDGVIYEIRGSNDLVTFDQSVSEVVPALTGTPDLPPLSEGWTYRTFRLDGAVGGDTPRGPNGFLDIEISEAP